MVEPCALHPTLATDISGITRCVGRLEESHHEMMSTQAGMAASLQAISDTMVKLEDTNIQIVALRGEVASLNRAFDKSETEHTEIFNRLRSVEEMGCRPRLQKLENTSTWVGRLVVGAIILGFIGLGFHALRLPIGYTTYKIPAQVDKTEVFK